MPQNWWDIYPEVLPSPAARQYPLLGPGGIVPGPAMGLGPALGLGQDPLYGAPRLGQAPGGGFDPSFLAGAPMLGQFAGSSPDQAPPIGYPQAPSAGDQAGPLSDRRLAVQQAAAAIRDGADPRAVRARLSQVGAGSSDFGPSHFFFDLLPGGGQVPGTMDPLGGPDRDMLSAGQPRFAPNSMPGRYGQNGIVDDATAQMPVLADGDFAKQPQAFLKAGGEPAQPGLYGGMQSGAGARFYPAAYTQDHLDTEQDWQVAYEMAKQRGGDPQDWFQMLRGYPPRINPPQVPPDRATAHNNQPRPSNPSTSLTPAMRRLRQTNEAQLTDPGTIAFLNTIAFAEGGKNYNTMFGTNRTFENMDTHPGMAGDRFNGSRQSAAGRYQIELPTYRTLNQRMGPLSMRPHDQDLMAVELLRSYGALAALHSGNLASAVSRVARIWAGLPEMANGHWVGSHYRNQGQTAKSFEEIQAYFNQALQQARQRSQGGSVERTSANGN